MRCKLCLTELPQGQMVCPICGLDNSNYYQEELKKQMEQEQQTMNSNNNQNMQTPSQTVQPTVSQASASVVMNQTNMGQSTISEQPTNSVIGTPQPVPPVTNVQPTGPQENVSVTMNQNNIGQSVISEQPTNSVIGTPQPVPPVTNVQPTVPQENVSVTMNQNSMGQNPIPEQSNNTINGAQVNIPSQIEPQEEIAASPIQQTAEQIPTPVSNTVPNSDIVTPIPELGGNTVTPQPMPSNTTGQTAVQQSDMIMPNNQAVTSSNATEHTPIQKQGKSMRFHYVFMFLTGFVTILSLIVAFLFQFNTQTMAPVVFSGITLFGLATRAKYGRILAMFQGITTAILGVLVIILGIFAAPLILLIAKYLSISFIPNTIICIIGIVILVFGICIFVYYKKRKELFH